MKELTKTLEETIEQVGKEIGKIEGLSEDAKKILLIIAAIKISETLCKIAVENPELIKEIYKNWIYESLALIQKRVKNA